MRDASPCRTAAVAKCRLKFLYTRFERIQQRHYGMKVMAYTWINLRAFCGI